MSASFFKKWMPIALAVLGLWLGLRYLLPTLLPFLLGAGVALGAEPVVRLGMKRCGMPRLLASGLGVTATLVGIGTMVLILGAVAVRELKVLTNALPSLADGAKQTVTAVQDWMIGVAEQAPESIRPTLQRTALSMLDSGTVILQQAAQKLPAVVTSAVGKVGDGVLGLGTGVISAYLISARLPKLKALLRQRLPEGWHSRYLPALRRVKTSLGGWLKAQLKLSAITWCIVSVGFVLLRIPYGPAWALLVALVDAVPILGTGTVLVPWAVVCFFQQQTLRAVSLLGIYGVALTARTILEPRMVGRQLGLDPLSTLVALYAGYRFWGIGGMLLMPVIASAAKSLATGE